MAKPLHHTMRLVTLYDRVILGHPLRTLAVAFALVIGLVSSLPQFRLDASADTLVLENDQALQYYRSIKAIYGSDDTLILTYSPQGDLFSDAVLDDLGRLRDKLTEIKRVE